MAKRILLVGIGNIIRQDDGVGPYCISLLKASIIAERKKLVDFFSVHQLDITCCEYFANYSLIIFIDADAGKGGEPFILQEVGPGFGSRSFSSHIGSIPDLLSLTGRIYGKTPKAYIVAIRGSMFEVGDRLSALAHNNACKAVEQINRLIDRAFPLC